MQGKSDFIQLIKDHEGIIYKITSVYASDREDQKDLYQEVVYQLWKSFGSFKQASKISTWMYRVALNTAISYNKKAKRGGMRVPIDLDLLNRAEEIDPVKEERIKLLYQHIKKLSVIEKGIIVLYLEGKSHAEIAEITGFSKSNVGTRVGRIKQKLSVQIKKETSWN